ncbi:GrpE-domain-containing protein [Tricharina praecox]|uniref:GrpE-domain-containing protein n=1 Tax=Tricharina praecox TaxID=43433 RepID=UPI00221F454E|nr:GrpE-domain-containing protein [Tricharina praecox]KAI5855841.1 GrpE-domain-containing protein [Tricharina praecox]
MFGRTILRQARLLVAPSVPRGYVAPLAARHLRPASMRLYSTTESAKTEEPTKAEESAKAAEQPEVSKFSEELEKALKELEGKKVEARDYKDKFTRAVADFRNLQDRTEREKKSAKDFAIQKFAKDLVESVDNLDRALKAVPESARSDPANNKDLVDFYNGLKMTEEILLNTLKKHGLEKVDPIGEVFDPNKHEATFQVPMADKEPNTVFHVQQTGFMLNGRTIRVSFVIPARHGRSPANQPRHNRRQRSVL